MGGVVSLSRVILVASEMIYLDHNATTPLDPEVFEAMRPYFLERWGNPSSAYSFGAENKSALEAARAAVATLIGAPSPRDILFTSGATEANNAALRAALRASPDRRHIITSAVEHSAVLAPCKDLERPDGYHVTYLPVNGEGALSLPDLESALTKHGGNTAVVSLMWANNETGVIFPISQIAALCRARGVPYHCDAVQAVGKLPSVDVRQIPVDYLSLSAHKFHGPKGVGALYVRRGAPWTPLLHGGHQERGRRGGTENVPLIVGLGRAAELAHSRLPNYDRLVRPLRDALERDILSTVPGTRRNGHLTERLPNTTNLSFPGIESEALLLLLEQEGICASSGSACLADSDEPSHVITAMSGSVNNSSLRMSLSSTQEEFDVGSVVATINKAVTALKEISPPWEQITAQQS